ncbi:MAG: helix-turn-helix domain-containing protein [Acidimicrobiales bacterium]
MAAALASAGLSQRQFAALLGTSQSRPSSYINGRVMPSAKLLVTAEHSAESNSAPGELSARQADG